jgi:two-component system, cell cycle sensor histidine kinase and response regulator CckA
MPLLSGVQVLKAARALRPSLRMALASGYVTPEIEQQALAAGARALLHKPDDVADMLATVQALLAAP